MIETPVPPPITDPQARKVTGSGVSVGGCADRAGEASRSEQFWPRRVGRVGRIPTPGDGALTQTTGSALN